MEAQEQALLAREAQEAKKQPEAEQQPQHPVNVYVQSNVHVDNRKLAEEAAETAAILDELGVFARNGREAPAADDAQTNGVHPGEAAP
jgi:hypothetical protein